MVESHRKKVFEKKHGKKYQFSEVLGQNVTGNEALSFRFLGLYFLKNGGCQ